MNFDEYISKSIENNRGYVIGSHYNTEYSNNLFQLYHYGTKIIEVDTKNCKVTYHYTCSTSDIQAINGCLHVLKKKGCVDRAYLSGEGLTTEYNEFVVEYSKIDEFKEIYNQLTGEQKTKINTLINKIYYLGTLKYSKLLLDEGYDNCIKELSKEVDKVVKKKENIYKSFKTYESIKDIEVLENKDETIIILFKDTAYHCENTIYLIDCKNKVIKHNNYSKSKTGRIFYDKKLSSYDKKKLKPIEITETPVAYQKQTLKIIKKYDANFHKYLVVKIANENI